MSQDLLLFEDEVIMEERYFIDTDNHTISQQKIKLLTLLDEQFKDLKRWNKVLKNSYVQVPKVKNVIERNMLDPSLELNTAACLNFKNIRDSTFTIGNHNNHMKRGHEGFFNLNKMDAALKKQEHLSQEYYQKTISLTSIIKNIRTFGSSRDSIKLLSIFQSIPTSASFETEDSSINTIMSEDVLASSSILERAKKDERGEN